MVWWVGGLKMLNLWWQWWQVGGWWRLTIFLMTNDDLLKAVHFNSKPEKKLCFFVLFLSGSKWKKNVSLLLQKNNNFFLYLFVLLVSPKMKKTNFPLLGFIKRRKKWYGIPNLVMTWWLRWVMVPKLSKCWWLHIEMVPKFISKKCQI